MRALLLQKVEYLNKELTELIEELEQYSHEELNTSPSEDSWSPIQILHHLILSEQLSIAYCKKKLSFEPDLKKAGLLSKLKAKLVELYLGSPFKFKAPPALNSSVLPKEGKLVDVATSWKKQREEMAAFLQDVPDKYLYTEVYKHPFGGRLSLEGMMDFFNAHFNNHRKQLRSYIN